MKNKKIIVISGMFLSLSSIGVFFLNGASQKVEDNNRDILCRSILSAAKIDEPGSLTSRQILEHASNRFGYGLSPYLRPNADKTAAKEALCAIADEIANPDKYPLINDEMKQFSQTVFQVTTDPFDNKDGSDNTGIILNPINNSIDTLSAKNQAISEALKSGAKTGDPVARQKAIAQYRQALLSSTVEARILISAFGSQSKDKNGDIVDRQVNVNSVLEDFWFNHFNISLRKTGMNALRGTLAEGGYERTIHGNMHSSFLGLLTSVIYHPAMLKYLDNNKSVYDVKTGVPSNQNLGRELLELHTLGKAPGVNYRQADVEASSLVLAGLNIDGASNRTVIDKLSAPDKAICNSNGIIDFKKFVLDCKDTKAPKNEAIFKARLNKYLSHLANHSSTKKNICNKLVKRFVRKHFIIDPDLTDDESTLTNESRVEVIQKDVVNSCISAWGANGNLPNMYKAIITHPNTWSPHNFSRRLKNPLELVVSAVRSYGMTLDQFRGTKNLNIRKVLVNQVSDIGLPYRTWTTPDGYKENYGWLSQGYLVRWVRASTSLSNLGIETFLQQPALEIMPAIGETVSVQDNIFERFKPWVQPTPVKELYGAKMFETIGNRLPKENQTNKLIHSALIFKTSNNSFINK